MAQQTPYEWYNQQMVNKQEQKKLLTEIMQADAQDGLYKQQTAVDWFVEQLPIRIVNMYYEAIKQAKEMQKQQITFAYGDGEQNGRECEQKLSKGEDCNVITSLEYYNKTYK